MDYEEIVAYIPIGGFWSLTSAGLMLWSDLLSFDKRRMESYCKQACELLEFEFEFEQCQILTDL